MIKENVAEIRAQIAAAAKKAGRDPSEIKLIGVTKTVDVPRISELLAAGVTAMGENRVQDFLPKYEEFSALENRPSEWHFIGHLQRNKVKFIADKVDLIHSVDSLPLATEINRHGEKIGKVLNILAEINISGESSKFGIPPDEILKFVENLVNMRFVRLSGLMTVAPFVENSEDNRGIFRKMRKILVDINTKCLYDSHIRDLSMGMSLDFATAIEEGATMVRIGTALFGERN
ncbi:MAG: YggS family pyridoxal phosphate-dependent enzyme [Defluviitaleaceae bacterium]|nr:YggS family pyridoxal phosphate-dependent enzyme [Defluviitaleaceae bacterium]MCL2262838.1 YggS family pyridoxal phosphate-dependent enzyme [Defluviitaleaceae bacterium]